MKMGKLIMFCLMLAAMVASCGPGTTNTKTSSVDTTKTQAKPQTKYAVGQYVWIDGVTKAYVYGTSEGCGCGSSDADGIGQSYQIAYASQDGEHHLILRENRLFDAPDTFYHKIVLPERLYQQLAAENSTLINTMVTTQDKLKDVEAQNRINNTWLSHFENHSKITEKTTNAQ